MLNYSYAFYLALRKHYQLEMYAEFPSTIKKIVIFNASGVTREIPRAMELAIKNTHPNPDKIIVSDHIEIDNDELLYIIICPAGLTPANKLPKYYINWQLENLGGVHNNPAYIEKLKGALYNWDYSFQNIKILKHQCNIKEFYVPPGYNKSLSLDTNYIYSDVEKDIDVLFLGWSIPFTNRETLRLNLFNAGLKVLFICDLGVNDMMKLIRRAKICVNVSIYEFFPLQKIRLNLLLANQSCIVSEIPLDYDTSMKLYENNGVVFVPYYNLVETCHDLLNNFEARKTLAMKSFEWYSNDYIWENIVDFNRLLPHLN